MKPYVGIVHKDRDSAYGIVFPDAPGCFAASDSMDGLFEAASEALSLWVEGMAADGRQWPKARDLDALKADPTWAEAFADAVLVIAAPAPLAPGKRAA